MQSIRGAASRGARQNPKSLATGDGTARGPTRRPRASFVRGVRLLPFMAVAAVACQTDQPADPPAVSHMRDQILVRAASEQLRQEDAGGGERVRQAEPLAQPSGGAAMQSGRASLLTGLPAASQPMMHEVLEQIPDPSEAETVFRTRAAAVAREIGKDPRAVKSYEMMTDEALQLLKLLARETKVNLTLAECVQKSLDSNYAIRISAHGPAIAQTSVVEAEAAFDAVFFLESAWDKRDNAFLRQVTQPVSNQRDTRTVEGGIRQLLPTGMRVSTSLRTSRSATIAERGVPNPVWGTDFVASFTQPLLRGFGLDVTRAQLTVARADQKIARERFLRDVRDTLFDVEQAYWTLVRARREVAIQAISTAQNKTTWMSMEQRKGHDASDIEVSNSRSRYESRYVNFLESVKLVRDAEDALKFLMNDGQTTLSQVVEIIPTDAPSIAPFVLDQFAEVRAAIDHRNEISEARATIEKARIQTAVAKNETLPQLDLSFSYDVGGLDVSADSSFDSMSTSRFRSYNVNVVFSYPLGNRGPRAAHQRARLQESQAVTVLQQVSDNVVREVNLAVRQLGVRFEQIPPQLEACRASDRNLRALEARSQVINPSFLETELSAVEQLNTARRTLLQVITDYNIAIVDLEKAKGTLLRYNNVAVADGPKLSH